ncbi:hypothetical protein BO86DRAFT_397828 [Aspergillus japonicus CBS 114.51]|uniref:RING-type domain-containing protein n=2 Tax=Aspergillus TaxID=5052 RepID=A0A2V5HS58_ASPV1|nr:hypothetical protein BO86DRAFT_397828 [Aspergillus japonicus CBS 114.51]PYI19110.1 hypothetical protein BO99DRAFT_412804 [Aspergillus violaceofuscus CBS 115571]RAH83834.1 hypothetical protein BO86DRAFT_397828 [Aspergillus japonicus CBS 114.51]
MPLQGRYRNLNVQPEEAKPYEAFHLDRLAVDMQRLFSQLMHERARDPKHRIFEFEDHDIPKFLYFCSEVVDVVHDMEDDWLIDEIRDMLEHICFTWAYMRNSLNRARREGLRKLNDSRRRYCVYDRGRAKVIAKELAQVTSRSAQAAIKALIRAALKPEDVARLDVEKPPIPRRTEETECSICGGRLGKRPVWCKSQCGHSFCFHCIDSWHEELYERDLMPNCPYCRQPWPYSLSSYHM